MSEDTQHAPSEYPNRAYCGAQDPKVSRDWAAVSCVNCHAAKRADDAVWS